MKSLIGRKVGMNQMFLEDGTVIPVTLLKMGPCVVMEKKTKDQYNYSALKLGFEEQKESRINKPEAGQFKKAGITPAKYVKEIRFSNEKDIETYNAGDTLDVSIFEEGKKVAVTGTSKGRGFAGVVKRYGFHGGPASHGAHEVHRVPGSVGAGTWPGRVLPGKKLPGHLGNKRVTVKNLKVMKVDSENGILVVKGAVPGPIKSIVIVKQD